MHNTSRFLDVIIKESHLPEIDGDACVHAFFDRSDCSACVDICPTHSWVLDDNALGLDTDSCDGCGLCVPACPSGALHIHFPWVIRWFGGQMIALFACRDSDIHEHSGLIPCIHALGLRQLLLMYNAGVEYLLVATGSCVDCNYHQENGIYQWLEQVNASLVERSKRPMKILQRSNQVWMQIFKADEVITRGARLSRREFIRGAGRQVRRQLVVLDPLNIPECRTVPPGQLLPTTKNRDTRLPWAPMLDEMKCNGCDACTRLCPNDALQLIHDDENVVMGYQLNPASCIGCGVCAAVCDMHAITIHSWSVSMAHTIDLMEKHCTACGSTYHLPTGNPLSETSSCRICREHNHNNRLFQVLSEN